MYYFKEYSSHRINNPPISKYLTSSVTRANQEPTFISSNKVKSLKLNTEPSPNSGIEVIGATCWLHQSTASPLGNPLRCGAHWHFSGGDSKDSLQSAGTHIAPPDPTLASFRPGSKAMTADPRRRWAQTHAAPQRADSKTRMLTQNTVSTAVTTNSQMCTFPWTAPTSLMIGFSIVSVRHPSHQFTSIQ